jgi:hypothetical protein
MATDWDRRFLRPVIAVGSPMERKHGAEFEILFSPLGRSGDDPLPEILSRGAVHIDFSERRDSGDLTRELRAVNRLNRYCWQNKTTMSGIMKDGRSPQQGTR